MSRRRITRLRRPVPATRGTRDRHGSGGHGSGRHGGSGSSHGSGSNG